MTVLGVVGLGVVGGTVARAMSQVGLTVRGFDPYVGMGDPGRLSDVEVVFVCDPPLRPTMTCSSPRRSGRRSERSSPTSSTVPELATTGDLVPLSEGWRG